MRRTGARANRPVGRRYTPPMPRVVIVGAGSVEFTRNIVADLCSYRELHGALTIALHDIDEDRLAYSGRAAESIVRRTGSGYSVEAHADPRMALEGAAYAINEIQVGGYAATLRDFEIPKKYGLRQTIGDTIGIGGVFRGLRTIPVLIEIAQDMVELCTSAMLLNYTNPMAMLPWAVWEATGLRNAIGLCHSVQNTHDQLSELVGIPAEEITFLTAGLNHQAFVLRFERDGEDLYP